MIFKRLDRNGNGTLDRAEYAKRGEKMFQRGDGNGDGFISQAEFNAIRDEMREARGARR